LIDAVSDIVPFKPRVRREDTTSFVGMAIFLGCWAMAFAAFFFAYFDVRFSAKMWPPPGEFRAPLLLPTINTVVLAISSLTLGLGLRAVRMANPAGLRRALFLTLALGALFVTLQVVVWRQLVAAGLRWDTGRYGTVFYALTVFHALHVVAGLIGLLTLLPGALAGRYTVARHAAVRNWGMFWHFVDGIWILMFFTLYVF
jgi:heme/copper-type cytochrome/quinol oxidase subunit 3